MRYLCLFLTSILSAATIVSVTGPTPATGQLATGVTQNQTVAVSWTQTGTYTGVLISADLGFGTGSPLTGTAYLTTQLGPGTTVAQEVTHSSFTMPTSQTTLQLLTIPLLGPGTYDLTLANTDTFGAWLLTNTPTTTTDTGVTKNTGFITGSPATYPPSTPFFTPYTGNLRYTVTGNTSAVPEPSTMTLLLTGILLIGARRATPRKHKAQR